ncbi:GreA/GreB family elongation factor [Pareuzebyella sediminis]|uniref:GreA/GreB family elongation factor n=1 Tax=Pareuzebyella sediminis TaxID=2607998 RepID=UPI0011EC81AB|nr:GreA/GreB family elongation factor [Pareuzebyella sediminis]
MFLYAIGIKNGTSFAFNGWKVRQTVAPISIEIEPMDHDNRVFEKRDYVALKRILNFHRHCEDFLQKDVFEILKEGLTQALVKNDEEMPSAIVRLNSKVTLTDEDGQTPTVQLVLPSEKNRDKGKVSVISTLGANLIGFAVGHKVSIEVLPKHKILEIVQVSGPNHRRVPDTISGMDF